MIMDIILSLVPVLVFLTCLFVLDSFKLVNKKTLAISMCWGVAAALISFYANTWLTGLLALDFNVFSRYLAPVIEEMAKGAIIIYLVSRKKIGFPVDAAVYGFAAGAGFAMTENIHYLSKLADEPGVLVWILRGFGTAVMHGGCTAILAMFLIGGIQRDTPLILAVIPGLLAGLILHSAFNHFLLDPYLQTALIFIVLPAVFVIVFRKSNHMLRDWLEIEFSHEVEMLSMIRRGKFSDTKAGNYLVSLKKYFSPEMILDLYCYISLYLELSIKAKRNLMLKENGLQVIEEPDINEKLTELRQLRKQIGKVGELALQPLIRMNYRELWKLNQLH